MTWPWITLILLGAWHGVNPGMGWLFAVSRGLQERRGGAVVGALPPIALGHALAIAVALVVVAVVRASVPLVALRWATAAILIGFGISRLFRHHHPRWVGMRVGFRDLTVWSFLMATAHGAGLMVLPVLLGAGTAQADSSGGAASRAHAHMAAVTSPLAGLFAAAVHTAGYLAVTGLIAWIVYRKVGLAVLRKAWFDVDTLWAVALVGTGVITFLM